MANFKKLIIGGIVYVILAIILGMIGGLLPIDLSPYAILLAALIAGIYVGRGAASAGKGAIDGIIAGIIGGIIAGIVTTVWALPGTTGVPLLDTLAVMLGTTITSYITILAGFGFFIGAGIILGAVGGFIGAKLKR
jgi:hypothetical protein